MVLKNYGVYWVMSYKFLIVGPCNCLHSHIFWKIIWMSNLQILFLYQYELIRILFIWFFLSLICSPFELQFPCFVFKFQWCMHGHVHWIAGWQWSFAVFFPEQDYIEYDNPTHIFFFKLRTKSECKNNVNLEAVQSTAACAAIVQSSSRLHI